MNIAWLRALFLIYFSILLFASLPLYAQQQDRIAWQSYSTHIFDQAKTSKHYILLYGKSKDCHWCQEMDKTTWQTPRIIHTIQTSYVPVLVDSNAEPDVIARYRIRSLPTMLILDSNNHIIKIFTGYFSPDFVDKNLKETAENYANAEPSSQPEIMRENEKPIATESLSTAIRDPLIKKQFSIFNQDKQSGVNLDAMEYALTYSSDEKTSAHDWVVVVLNSQSKSLDPVWGGMYADAQNGEMKFEKKAATQADTLEIYSLAYRYLQDPAYISIADTLMQYINLFLTSPEGVFYAGQEAAADPHYYQLEDKQRRELGVPKIDRRIFARENGLMITALVHYYMVKGDDAILEKAEKASQWMHDQLAIPGGGFRHEKTDSRIIYLDDTLAMGEAYLALYQATHNPDYLNRAVDAAEFINTYFLNNKENSGYFTALALSDSANGTNEIKADENADIVRFSSLLFSYTGDKFLQQMQHNAFHYLITPAALANSMPALTLMADYRVSHKPIHIVIVGPKNDPRAKLLYTTALSHLPLYTRIDWWNKKEGPLLNSDSVYTEMDKPVAYVCHGFQCSFPLAQPHDLSDMLRAITLPTQEKITPPQGYQETRNFSYRLSDTIHNSTYAETILKGNNWFLIVLGFLGFGLLLSFTPCILPLVPIMASIIVGQTIGVKKSKTFLLCLIYVLSMSLAYAGLGLAAGMFGVSLQVYMQKTWIIILFSLIFFILALSMLGAYELTVPRFMQQKIYHWSNLQKGGTYFGVFIMGGLSTLIVSPCVTAPLMGVLSFITQTSNYTLGAVGLFFMGFGMGIPLLIISLFSKDILPKASRWNHQIKSFFGLILLGVSIWVLSRVISAVASMFLWSTLIILTSIYMGITKRKTKSLFAKLWKTLTIMLFMYGIALFWNVLLINSDIYQELSNQHKSQFDNQTVPVFQDIKHSADLERVFADAKAKNLPILLDFSAKWCSSCVAMDRDVFADATTSTMLSKFILARVDLTETSPDSMALARQFSVVAPPIVLFFNADGHIINLRATGDLNAKQFQQILMQALDSSKAPP